MCLISKDLNLTTSESHILAQDIRLVTNSRSVIESGYKQKMYESNHQLDTYFDHKTVRFIKTDKKNKLTENLHEPVILCTDVNELIKKVIEERELNEDDLLVRIGLDGGGDI